MRRAKISDPGERALAFINNLTHTGDFSGVPFELRPWQADPIRKLFGTIRADGLRRYKKAFIAWPRKQGKTEWAAAILLYLLFGTGLRGQRWYSASGDRAQASLVFGAAASMIRADPELDDRCLIYDGYKKIIYEPMDSTYEALSSDAPRKHGLCPSGVIFDEVHVLPDRKLHNVLTTGYAARKDPLTLYITTAGHDRTSLCYELWRYAEQVRDGVIDDPGFLPLIYAADPKDDWREEATWRKAMPALGDFCSLEFIQSECREAQGNPDLENRFKQLYLNIWTEQATRWLQTELWSQCPRFDPVDNEGRECYGGLDLGIVGDMTAFARIFPNDDGTIDVTVKFWAPKQGKWRAEPRNKELYRNWEQLGHLTFTEGQDVDLDQVESDILELNEQTPIKLLVADRAYARQFLSRLFNNHGMNVEGISQGPVALNESMTKVESMLLEGQLRHDGNPVLAWNVANATVKRTSTGLMHLDKSGSTFRMDGLAAVIDAIAGWIADPNAGGSVYRERGVLII